jgi:hypothetical protein
VQISGAGSNTDLAHSTIVVNSTTLTLGDAGDTLTAASSTLLSDVNTWTKLQTFALASSTQLTVGSSNKFYINSSGEVTAYDTATGYQGQLSPVSIGGGKLATTTTWTASTSEPYDYDFPAPFTGTIKDITCFDDAGTLTVELSDASTHVYLTGASTTANTNAISLSMTKNDKLNMLAGTPASSPTWITCGFSAVRTP